MLLSPIKNLLVLMLNMIKTRKIEPSYSIEKTDFISSPLGIYKGSVVFSPVFVIHDEPYEKSEAFKKVFEEIVSAFAENVANLKELDRPLFQSEKEAMKSSLEDILYFQTLIKRKE
jgi:hypothetical protein